MSKKSIPTDHTSVERKKIFDNSYKNFLEKKLVKNGKPIPKIVHQVWLGSEIPETYKKWGETFKKFNPDFEYKLWTEKEVENLHMINRNAYEKTNNFGAKSDFLRYEILYQFGGLYADTDVECFGSFQKLHQETDFYGGLLDNREDTMILTCLMGSIPRHPVLKKCIDNMVQPITTRDAQLQVKLADGPFFTECFLACHEDGDTSANAILPSAYFYPLPAAERHNQNRKHMLSFVTSETIAVHYWEVSWHPQTNVIGKIVRKLLPVSIKEKIKKFIKY